MKKTALLFTLALVGVAQLYGMEPENPYASLLQDYALLPQEIKQEIIKSAMQSGNTLDEAAQVVKKFIVINNISYDNPEDITIFVKALKNKFSDKSEQDITVALNKQGLVALGGKWKTALPDDVKPLIMVALSQAGNSLDEAIKNIIKVSLINKDLNAMVNVNDLHGFTGVVHLLADKFGKTTEEIAEKFKTPIAKKYVDLGRKLLENAQYPKQSAFMIQLIKEGADVDYTGFDGEGNDGSVLWFAIKKLNVQGVKYLLAYGAQITNSELLGAKNMASLPAGRLKIMRPGSKGDEGKTIYDIIINSLSLEQLDQLIAARKNKK